MHGMKNLKFKLDLRNFLLHHSFYILEKYFNTSNNLWTQMIVLPIFLMKTLYSYIFISLNYWKYVFSIHFLNISVHYRMYIFCNHYMSFSAFDKTNSINSFISIQPLGRFSRNQNPVRPPVWLWHTASWASSQAQIIFLRGRLPLLSPTNSISY